ncbi:TrmO family methyltransferase domain-containing protein [Paracraurococcus ruber]|uniref:TrmO family methyltransferase domain-containing protein n=1 Tax=Paracraurococcus ruber TaxID=77675 RepID=UPI00190423E3|nr:TrmO family methyltransferase [Paracraurococcus ruber]
MPQARGAASGTFAPRSPSRPSPIGTSVVTLVGRDNASLPVRGPDCLGGTPLLGPKPERSGFRPPAPPTPGDVATGRARPRC